MGPMADVEHVCYNCNLCCPIPRKLVHYLGSICIRSCQACILLEDVMAHVLDDAMASLSWQ